MRGRRLWYAAIFAGLLLWVLYTPGQPKPLHPIREPAPPADLAVVYDPARCGSVRGTVRWSGDVLVVEPIRLLDVRIPPQATPSVPNPNRPRVNNGRIEEVIVYLAGVDPRRAAPWKPAPVSVEVKRCALLVKEGDRTGRVAIVRRGEAVALICREAIDPVSGGPALHSIRGRGAAVFTQMLPVPDKPVSRTLTDAATVELSSGSGYYWLRGYLFVSDHPYAVVTRSDGTFTFANVPDGEYDAVCWLPNWHVDRFENDPELSMWGGPARMTFRPAVEKRQKIMVTAGQPTTLTFTLSAADFDR
jgi:hypothetical protein